MFSVLIKFFVLECSARSRVGTTVSREFCIFNDNLLDVSFSTCQTACSVIAIFPVLFCYADDNDAADDNILTFLQTTRRLLLRHQFLVQSLSSLSSCCFNSSGETHFSRLLCKAEMHASVMTMGQRVTGQVGQQIWVGHVGHGSVLMIRWPMIKLTRFQEQAILWHWWCLILRALSLSDPDWKLQ